MKKDKAMRPRFYAIFSKKSTYIAAAFIGLLVFIPTRELFFRRVNVNSYSGDGHIVLANAGLARGYAITFNSFKLSEKVRSTYHLKVLPDTGKDVAILIRLLTGRGDEDLRKISDSRKELGSAHIGLRATSKSGGVIFNVSGELEDMDLSIGPNDDDGRPTAYLYFLECIIPKELISDSATFQLDFEWEGKSQSDPGDLGVLVVRSGGHW